MFSRDLYDTEETNSFLDMFALYCLIFEDVKFFFSAADWHCDVGLILYFLQCRYKNKNIRMRTVK